jgi:hypothetical protein
MENTEDFIEGVFGNVEVVCFWMIVNRRRLLRAVLRQFVRHFSFILRADNPDGERSEASPGGTKVIKISQLFTSWRMIISVAKNRLEGVFRKKQKILPLFKIDS